MIINTTTFAIQWMWYEIIKDTLLMFEQFFYVTLLSSLVPGSIMVTGWIIKWLEG
jgi:hypothetical protein|tara:strand:+ start:48 stop:212 length:165 start_codon:yes stop_codon:yes gene_type:complete